MEVMPPSDQTKHKGSCSCGAVQITASGAPFDMGCLATPKEFLARQLHLVILTRLLALNKSSTKSMRTNKQEGQATNLILSVACVTACLEQE